MEENAYKVEMVYIQNTSGANYSVETEGRSGNNIKLSFANVEGIEVNTVKPMEITNSSIQMNDGQPKIWLMRFAYPTDLSIRYAGKIIIKVI